MHVQQTTHDFSEMQYVRAGEIHYLMGFFQTGCHYHKQWHVGGCLKAKDGRLLVFMLQECPLRRLEDKQGTITL